MTKEVVVNIKLCIVTNNGILQGTGCANCETDPNCDQNVARFQPIKTLTKLLLTFSNLLSFVIG